MSEPALTSLAVDEPKVIWASFMLVEIRVVIYAKRVFVRLRSSFYGGSILARKCDSIPVWLP